MQRRRIPIHVLLAHKLSGKSEPDLLLDRKSDLDCMDSELATSRPFYSSVFRGLDPRSAARAVRDCCVLRPITDVRTLQHLFIRSMHPSIIRHLLCSISGPNFFFLTVFYEHP